MIEDLRPIKVRVSEALGWGPLEPVDWLGVPNYDRDWLASGPLVDRYGITLVKESGAQEWSAYTDYGILAWDPPETWSAAGKGPTPLLAICNLVLQLKENQQL